MRPTYFYNNLKESGVALSVSGTATFQAKALTVGIGSPTSFFGAIQAGSSVTDAGSLVWVSYGTAFLGAPIISLTNKTNIGGLFATNGSIGTGSFIAHSETAETAFDWVAVGSI